jgi:hypothetical protein
MVGRYEVQIQKATRHFKAQVSEGVQNKKQIKVQRMRLWPLNKEFHIEITYPSGYAFPSLSVRKNDGAIIMDVALWEKPLMYYMEELHKRYPQSEFLEKLFKQTGR